ncbi:GNAT family N-acetyltransferase [Planotetraspora kaengkrachanensis]|uniref:GNAT family N-acetyltransferase n=1 Tax=Planotetraspora kaengkrachanensis TaxID=575193 RepID=A0A8J3PQ46_9ACTN|nr:GNAT family N-acetyltransferase [Planotetraspora kaengkrachanensis]GIG77014.1 GNAT family N-acetyltransferase [Planotetraspora kaengkrachanensis]
MGALEIELLPAAAGGDRPLAERITTLVNDVYAVAERGLWADGAVRTTADEVGELIGAGQIAVARLDGQIVGCVRVRSLDDGVGEFGMLAAHPAHRGTGVGRELVRFAERTSRARGIATMQLELLVPREWAHPSKEFLAAWYSRSGYRRVDVGSIEETYPALAPSLATPCDYLVYHKDLTA